MSGFYPGAGWREARENEVRREHMDEDYLYAQVNGKERYWVPEVPVPALPTAPYTVIRVVWIQDADDDMAEMWVRGEDQWAAVEQDQWATPDWLSRSTTSFVVLSEPRAVTAKAVLERVRDAAGPEKLVSVGLVDVIAREFGVGS